MGQFSNTLFTLLLGWVKTAASAVWSAAVDSAANGGLQWLLDHWLILLVLLCVAGSAVDFLVYLVRWQPYRVWRSFLHGRKRRTSPPEDEGELLYQRQWVYADGSTEVEDVRKPRRTAETAPNDSEQMQVPLRPVRRVARRAPMEQAYCQPVYPQGYRHTEDDQHGGQA